MGYANVGSTTIGAFSVSALPQPSSNPRDLNGDGKSDLIFQNTTTGQRVIWYMNGTTFAGTGDFGTLDPAWQFVDTGDFNGDGKPDMVLQNTVTGDRYVWFLDGIRIIGSAFIANVPPVWQIAVVGDFNNDGKPDLVFQNASTGQRVVWFMNGASYAGTADFGTLDPAWQFVGTGDFNADGKPDMVLQNTSNGDRYVWFLDGTRITGGQAIGNAPVAWSIAGTGDYNGDGKPDIVLQNTSTGDRVVWFMNGASYAGGASLGTIATAWSIALGAVPLDRRVTTDPPTIAGVAAVGAALANANILVTDFTGANACAQTSIVTSGTGAFSCSILAGSRAPFVITASDPWGLYPPLVSVATAVPAGGTTLTANVTPLTTAIAAQLAPDGNALSLRANPALVNAAALATITRQVLTQIAPVLATIGAPAGYDPFTTQIVAGSLTLAGNTADQVIETLRFTSVNGVNMVATVDNPNGAVPLATATTTPPALPAPSATLVSLQDSLRLVVNTLRGCFAQPVNSRVLTVDTSIPQNQGGPSVTGMAPSCREIAHPAYLMNGYRFGQRYYGLLRDTQMDGATFSPAEIMLFSDDTTASDQDVAVANIRFVDANGVAGNLIEVLRKLPGSATALHPSDWWLYGNQQEVDSLVRAFVRRQEQLAPNPGQPGPFVNASSSRYETGIEIFVNKDGPGSSGLRAARIKGPGLPPAGLVYTRPNPDIITDQNWLNIRRKDGLTDPVSATPSADVGNIFRLQRSLGLTGTAPLPVRPNPNENNTNNLSFPQWAHPVDYGMPVGTPATGYIDFSALRANISYTFELYFDGEITPRYTYVKTMLTPVIPAVWAVNLRWLALTAPSLRYFDPADALAAAPTTANFAWTPNAFAETVRSAGFYTFNNSQTVSDAIISLARGSNSCTAVAPSGFSFAPLTSDGTSGRVFQLRYQMLDGSYKDATTRYN